jgi:hypothetical protein
LKLIQNSTWTNPAPPIEWLLVLIGLTILIETSFVYLYARKRRYTEIAELIVVLVCANMLTGLVGLMIGTFM